MGLFSYRDNVHFLFPTPQHAPTQFPQCLMLSQVLPLLSRMLTPPPSTPLTSYFARITPSRWDSPWPHPPCDLSFHLLHLYPLPPLPEAALDVPSIHTIHTGSSFLALSTLHFTLGWCVSLPTAPWGQGTHHSSPCSQHPAQCWWMIKWNPTLSFHRRRSWG